MRYIVRASIFYNPLMRGPGYPETIDALILKPAATAGYKYVNANTNSER